MWHRRVPPPARRPCSRARHRRGIPLRMAPAAGGNFKPYSNDSINRNHRSPSARVRSPLPQAVGGGCGGLLRRGGMQTERVAGAARHRTRAKRCEHWRRTRGEMVLRAVGAAAATRGRVRWAAAALVLLFACAVGCASERAEAGGHTIELRPDGQGNMKVSARASFLPRRSTARDGCMGRPDAPRLVRRHLSLRVGPSATG